MDQRRDHDIEGWFQEVMMGWGYFITTQERRWVKMSINNWKQKHSNGVGWVDNRGELSDTEKNIRGIVKILKTLKGFEQLLQ